MKKLAFALVVAVLLLAVGGTVFAQNWDGYFKPGNVSLSVGVGLGFGWGFGFGVYPGVEFTVAEWKVGGVVPLAFGVAAKGLVDYWPLWGFDVGAGGFGTVHLGFKGLDIPPFLQRFDIYTAIGLAVSYSAYTGWWTSPLHFGLATYGGTNYFLNDKLALFLEGVYWWYYGSTTVGVLLKL